jgi:hypothetical protein
VVLFVTLTLMIRSSPLAAAEVPLFATVLAVRTPVMFSPRVLSQSVCVPWATVKRALPRVQCAALNATAAQLGGPEGVATDVFVVVAGVVAAADVVAELVEAEVALQRSASQSSSIHHSHQAR